MTTRDAAPGPRRDVGAAPGRRDGPTVGAADLRPDTARSSAGRGEMTPGSGVGSVLSEPNGLFSLRRMNLVPIGSPRAIASGDGAAPAPRSVLADTR